MDDLNIILPVYNEKNSIEQILQEWSDTLKKIDIEYKFIICEDGSTDGTKELLLDLLKEYPIILNQINERRGYGKAVVDGIKATKSEFILCIDSDGQCDPNDFLKFWDKKNDTNVIIGWRITRLDNIDRKIYSNMFKIIVKILFPIKIHDPSCPYVLFKREHILDKLKYLLYLSEGFWWGFIGMCKKKNLTISEIKINHLERICGGTRVFTLDKIIGIAFRNLKGLIKLKTAT